MSDKDRGYKWFLLTKRVAPYLIVWFLFTLTQLQYQTVVLANFVYPFAFSWLMWALTGIKQDAKAQKERIEKLEGR